MGEFGRRVEAQRQILKVVNSRDWSGEQLFAVTTSRNSTMGIDRSPRYIDCCCEALALCLRPDFRNGKPQ